MKTITSIIYIFITIFQVYTQNWVHYYGEYDKKESSSDVIETYDKGYISAGRIRFQTDEWIHQSWLIKTDINGNLLWDKVLINNDNVVLMGAIDECIDGGILVCGSIEVNNTYYPFILKLNSCGEKEWCHRIPGSLNIESWAEDIKELPNGDIIVLFTMFGQDPEETMHLFKFSANGNYQWDNSYCNGFNHDVKRPLGENIQLTTDNKVIICGSSYWKNPWEPGSDVYWIRPTFTKVDPESGEEEWVLPFGIQDTILGDAYHFVQKQDGNYIGFASDWTDDNYVHPLFIEFNNDGNLLNYKQIHSSVLDPSFEESHFEDGFIIDSNLYLIGLGGDMENDFPMINVVMDTNVFTNELNIININIQESVHWPIFTIKTFDNKIINAATFKEPGNWDIFLTKLNLELEQDSIYSAQYTYDSLCPFPISSGLITLDDCFPVGFDDEIPTPNEYYNSLEYIPITIFPNPASDFLNVSYENTAFHNDIILKVYNIHGKIVHEGKIISGQLASELDVISWTSGLYSIVLTANSNNSIIGKKKFIVK